MRWKLVGRRERDERELIEADERAYVEALYKAFPHRRGQDCYCLTREEQEWIADYIFSHPKSRILHWHPNRDFYCAQLRLGDKAQFASAIDPMTGNQAIAYRRVRWNVVGCLLADSTLHNICAGNREIITGLVEKLDALEEAVRHEGDIEVRRGD